jgi:hypothetical protein
MLAAVMKHWKLLLFALAALAAAGAVRSWVDAREARARLDATLSAQKALLDQASAREAQRSTALQQALEEIAELKRRVQTPQQVIRELPQYLPPLPQPIEVKLPEPAPGAAAANPPPAIAQIPQQDLKPLFDFVQDCRACKAQLDAAHGDLVDERAKIQALTRERDAALRVARGGGFWTRAKHAAKWFAIGAAVGAAAVAAHH